MSSIYFDQHYGVSGDMINAALLNMEDNFDILIERLSLLNIEGYRVEYKLEKRNHILGGRFIVHTDEKSFISRNYSDIKRLISNSGLNQEEKELSLKIFKRIAEAESRVHGIDISKIHFHEVGALDSIVDIVGFSILISALKIGKCHASSFYLGNGKIMSQHGEIPIPAPATVEILKGYPVVGTVQNSELTTPTGAAIITSIAEDFGSLPGSIIKKVGLGFGSRENDLNALRVYLLEEVKEFIEYNDETLLIVETTIDDSTAEEIAFLQEILFQKGVLDLFITPVIMKKGRSGFNVTIIAYPNDLKEIIDTIFINSSTFGIRYNFVLRKSLKREIIKVNGKYGKVSIKIGYYGNKVIKYSPEYEICSKISREKGIPLRAIYEDAIMATKRTLEK